MTVLSTGLVLVLLASGLGVAIWVSRLKGQALFWMKRHAEAVTRLSREQVRGQRYLAQRRRAEAQLAGLRKDYEELLQKMETGALCDADGIAALLRRVPADDA